MQACPDRPLNYLFTNDELSRALWTLVHLHPRDFLLFRVHVCLFPLFLSLPLERLCNVSLSLFLLLSLVREGFSNDGEDAESPRIRILKSGYGTIKESAYVKTG